MNEAATSRKRMRTTRSKGCFVFLSLKGKRKAKTFTFDDYDDSIRDGINCRFPFKNFTTTNDKKNSLEVMVRPSFTYVDIPLIVNYTE